MCIIAVCKNFALTKDVFERCFSGNGHGVGFAYSDGKQVTFRKGFMTREDAWDAYQGTPTPHVVHFRLASVGGVQPDLTHPFLCTPGSPLVREYAGTDSVLFHNGSVSEWKQIIVASSLASKVVPVGDMSDTRALACAVGVCGHDFLTMYQGKFVIVTPSEILTIGSFVTDEETGNLFSNNGFERSNFNVLSFDRRFDSDRGRYTNDSALFPYWNRDTNDKACSTCLHYGRSNKTNEPWCTKKDKRLADDRPCNVWESDDALDSDSDEGSSCLDCRFYQVKKKRDSCQKLSIYLCDLKVCPRFEVKKHKKTNGSVSGARIMNGVVEENYLDRLSKLHTKGE